MMNKWWVDRRGVIFLVFSVAAVALLTLCPDKYDWVGTTIAIAYVVLGVGSWLDHLSRARRTPK